MDSEKVTERRKSQIERGANSKSCLTYTAKEKMEVTPVNYTYLEGEGVRGFAVVWGLPN